MWLHSVSGPVVHSDRLFGYRYFRLFSKQIRCPRKKHVCVDVRVKPKLLTQTFKIWAFCFSLNFERPKCPEIKRNLQNVESIFDYVTQIWPSLVRVFAEKIFEWSFFWLELNLSVKINFFFFPETFRGRHHSPREEFSSQRGPTSDHGVSRGFKSRRGRVLLGKLAKTGFSSPPNPPEKI